MFLVEGISFSALKPARLCYSFHTLMFTLEFCFWSFSVIALWPSEILLLKLKCKTFYQVPWTLAIAYSQSFVSSFEGLQEGYPCLMWVKCLLLNCSKSCMCYSMGALSSISSCSVAEVRNVLAYPVNGWRKGFLPWLPFGIFCFTLLFYLLLSLVYRKGEGCVIKTINWELVPTVCRGIKW